MSDIEVTYNNYTNTMVWETEGFKFIADKADGMSKPVRKKNELRLYANNTLEIRAWPIYITSISFDISEQGLKRFACVEASDGYFVQNLTDPLVWKGNSPNITFKVGERSEGTESGAGQFDFYSMTITTDEVDGISEPTEDLVPTKYYNTLGIEVTDLQPGVLYIRIQGSRASKYISY